MMAEG